MNSFTHPKDSLAFWLEPSIVAKVDSRSSNFDAVSTNPPTPRGSAPPPTYAPKAPKCPLSAPPARGVARALPRRSSRPRSRSEVRPRRSCAASRRRVSTPALRRLAERSRSSPFWRPCARARLIVWRWDRSKALRSFSLGFSAAFSSRPSSDVFLRETSSLGPRAPTSERRPRSLASWPACPDSFASVACVAPAERERPFSGAVALSTALRTMPAFRVAML